MVIHAILPLRDNQVFITSSYLLLMLLSPEYIVIAVYEERQFAVKLLCFCFVTRCLQSFFIFWVVPLMSLGLLISIWY